MVFKFYLCCDIKRCAASIPILNIELKRMASASRHSFDGLSRVLPWLGTEESAISKFSEENHGTP
jgi:hypothetical protein